MAHKIQTDIAVTANTKGAVGEIRKISESVENTTKSVSSFQKKLDSINLASKITAVASGMAIVERIGGAVVGAVSGVINSVDGFAAKADTISKFSRNVGLSAEALQKWHYAAERSGMSTEQFDNAIRKMSVNISKAANGEKKQLEMFNAMGISLRKGNGELKSNNELMLEVADAYKKIGNAQDRIRISEELFGRGNVGIGNLFEGGSEAINELLQRRERIGGLVSDEDAKKAEEFKDLLLDVDKIKEAIGNKAMSKLLPSLNKGFEEFLEWWDVNGENVLDKVKIAVDVVIYSVEDFIGLCGQAYDVIDNFSLVFDGLKITAGEFFGSVRKWMNENLVDPFFEFFDASIPDKVSMTMESFKNFFKNVGGFILGFVDRPMRYIFGYGITEMLSVASSTISKVFGGIVDSVRNVFAGIGKFALQSIASVADALSNLPLVGERFAGVSSGIRNVIASAEQESNPAAAETFSRYSETRTTQTNRLEVDIRGLNKESSVKPSEGFDFGVIDYSTGYAFGG